MQKERNGKNHLEKRRRKDVKMAATTSQNDERGGAVLAAAGFHTITDFFSMFVLFGEVSG
jgi:hypothetical protein